MYILIQSFYSLKSSLLQKQVVPKRELNRVLTYMTAYKIKEIYNKRMKNTFIPFYPSFKTTFLFLAN